MATSDVGSHGTRGNNGSTVSNGANGATASSGTTLGAVLRFGRDLPHKVRESFDTNPLAVVAGVGAGSFLLGALLASKLGRVAAVTAVTYGVNRLLEGPIGREIEQYAKSVLKPGEA